MAVIGGGPSGAVAAALLASWGHDVHLLTRPIDRGRGLANSLPPSTRKLLEQTRSLDLVDRVGHRTTGNTVWWGSREGRSEPFGADESVWGYQVDRARLDPLLLQQARMSGARVSEGAVVRSVQFGTDAAVVSYADRDRARAIRARLVLDCSGRSGIVARLHRLRRHVRGGRMQALIGIFRRPAAWTLENPSHTFIETCDDGWAWSIPVSDEVRHVGVMIDGATSRLHRGESVASTFCAQLARTPRLEAQTWGAVLEHAFACDASVYTARAFAGRQFLLVGDAGSTINPLSSFGVKKALASAWLASVVTRTCLTHPERTAPALEFFSRWESDVWRTNLQRSREFAREALARHRGPFWETQASVPADEERAPIGEHGRLGLPAVGAALDQLRRMDAPRLRRNAARAFVDAPVVRGNTIVLEPAMVCVGDAAPLRFVRNVDLVALTTLASDAQDVPTLFARYNARAAAVPLPDFIAAASLLVASEALTLVAG